MTSPTTTVATLNAFDGETAALVRLSAQITMGSEEAMRRAFGDCAVAGVAARWVEELVLQSYLFAGFPRALNAARVWRRIAARRSADGGIGAATSRVGSTSDTPDPAQSPREGYENLFDWRERGQGTCAAVYGEHYEKLRENIRALHPALDEWMIVEGYGKVLSRPGLDLARRELCIIAACVAAGQDRQLHSHLLGAINVGVTADVIGASLDALDGLVVPDHLIRARLLWQRLA